MRLELYRRPGVGRCEYCRVTSGGGPDAATGVGQYEYCWALPCGAGIHRNASTMQLLDLLYIYDS